MYKRAFAAGLAVFFLFTGVSAQKAEVTISLNEPFFDALLDSIFQNFDPPEFSIAQNGVNRRGAETQSIVAQDTKVNRKNNSEVLPFAFLPFTSSSASPRLRGENSMCSESVKILREMNGVRTAVRFRDGKIYVPLAFSGGYAPPFVGCVDFAGWAEANIDLEFDQAGQRLIGRVRVLNVNLNGTGGVGATVIAKLIQSSIDKKLNPMEIMRLDNVSFGVPIQNNRSIRMKAVSVRPELGSGVLNVHIVYEFLKG